MLSSQEYNTITKGNNMIITWEKRCELSRNLDRAVLVHGRFETYTAILDEDQDQEQWVKDFNEEEDKALELDEFYLAEFAEPFTKLLLYKQDIQYRFDKWKELNHSKLEGQNLQKVYDDGPGPRSHLLWCDDDLLSAIECGDITLVI